MQIWDLFDLYNQPNIEHSNKVVTYHKKLLSSFKIQSQTIGLVLVCHTDLKKIFFKFIYFILFYYYYYFFFFYSPTKLNNKRIMLFTNNDDPHAGNTDMQVLFSLTDS
jgi:hypothetical protein